jgi:hypothetical protein
MSDKRRMHESGESSSGVVPARLPNEGQGGAQEVVEGRPQTKENTEEPNSGRTRVRTASQTGWTVCGKPPEGTRDNGSRPCCTR